METTISTTVNFRPYGKILPGKDSDIAMCDDRCRDSDFAMCDDRCRDSDFAMCDDRCRVSHIE
ncbi:hypothetical protein COOONC_17725 [Cooperia oncophora]